MPDFDGTRRELNELIRELAQQRRARAADLHATRRLERARAESERRQDAVGARTLDARLGAKRQRIQANRAAETALRERLAAARKQYLAFSDPREHLGQWRDDLPILLFPLRLETRFRTIGEGEATRFQLWVRAYPDSCLIDTFADLPSDAEYRRARTFWIATYRVGLAPGTASDAVSKQVRDGQLDAWRGLLDQSSPGRAYWLTQNVNPSPGQAPSERLDETDIFLVIPTEGGGPDAAVRGRLVDYYSATWRAQGDPELLAQARQDFVDATGDEETAADLLARYPVAGLPDGDPRSAGPGQRVEVTFLDFPAAADVDRTVTAWSDPAKVGLLPDRLLLQGYRNGELVVDEIGPIIPQPLTIGPDPGEDHDDVLREAFPELYADGNEPDDDRKASAYVEYLKSRSDTRWLFDFAEARRVGMGFVVDLDAAAYRAGFDRLFVVGLRLSSDANEGKTDLEELLRNHQYGAAGCSFLPQGTPTNATATPETAAAAFDRFFGEAPDVTPGASARPDGQWFADLLGLDATAAGLTTAANFYGTDQAESLAAQRALYPATMGYFLDSMLDTVTDEGVRWVMRDFFARNVSPRGRMPLLRISDQPYGILPITGRNKGRWLNPRRGEESGAFSPIFGISDQAPVLRRLLGHLDLIRADWETRFDRIAHLWRPGDPYQNLLDVLGLHSGSVEWDQRMGETTKQYANRLKLEGFWALLLGAIVGGAYLQRSRDLFARHGIELDADGNGDDELARELPRIMKILFFGRINPLAGPLVDDRPLTETDRVRAYTPDGKNYLEWLLDAMENEPARLSNQQGFSPDDRPRALLYQLLRHATDLQAVDTGLDLYRRADLLTANERFRLRQDLDFIGVQERPGNSVESRYDLLYRAEPQITNATGGGTRVIDHLATLLAPGTGRSDWSAHRDALRTLTDVPTARLERLLAEHLDSCHYRLDAWLQGFTDLQLRGMRYGNGGEETGQEDLRDGIYLGAYGWVENLRPDHERLEPAELTAAQRRVFAPDPDDPAPLDNSQNGGYLHAPSLDHATTAAVLRNAYIGNALPEDPDRYAINLSSERVRRALELIEGMRAGQELGALLGYRLERGLHDSPLELDAFIYRLRAKYPLVANRLRDTALEDDEFDAQEQIAANNVVDGLRLVEVVTGGTSYPYNLLDMPGADSPEGAAITALVNELVDLEDAVADLALAESVHQTVKGNYDRAAGALNAYSKGQIPPVPEVARTPRKGSGLTHRFALHLDPAATASGSPLAEVEPAVAAWVADVLPDPATVAVRVDVEPAIPDHGGEVTLAELGWTAVDLLYQFDRAGDKEFGKLDEAIQHFIHRRHDPGPTARVTIRYTERVNAPVSCFELLPLVDDVRQLVLAVRGLRSTDLRPASEARAEDDATVVLDATPYARAHQQMNDRLTELQTEVAGPLTAAGVTPGALTDMNTDAVYAAVVANIDAWVRAYGERVQPLFAFRPLNAHSDLAYGGRLGLSRQQATIAADFHAELTVLLDQADQLLAALPPAADAATIAATLKKVEPLVSTTFFTGEDLVAFTDDVTDRRAAFAAYLDELAAHRDRTHASLRSQTEELAALLDPVRLAPLTTRRVDLTEVRARTLVLAQDLLRAASELIGKGQVLSGQGDAMPKDSPEQILAACRMLLGEDFQVLPRFQLPAPAFQELTAAYADRATLLRYQEDTMGEPFPVDSWLHGLARVRPFVGHWERLQLYAEDYPGAPELDCVPLQFPWRPDDHWLGLEFPAGYPLTEERLLYTAHYAPAPAPGANLFCGLLLDEWTEVIPAREEDTGLTFHFDQPATEPAQTWLLALPSDFTGAWRWDELVDCLHEGLDLARLRTVEPETFADSAYSHLLPTTVSTVTRRPVTTQLNYAAVNGVQLQVISPDVSS